MGAVSEMYIQMQEELANEIDVNIEGNIGILDKIYYK